MTQVETVASRNAARTTTTEPAIRPFRFEAPQEQLDDLQRRLTATRWPEKETVNDGTQGVQLATIQKLVSYWLTEYDWRKMEAKINSYPNFITNIDGLDIHFIHVKSKHENALPIIVTHGWPGSITEQMKIIGPLTDPTAFGGRAEDAYDVVIPSIPGYGFSGKPTEAGWDVPRIASAWITLMKRLGYSKYVAQGGDWGAVISELMGVMAPAELLGIHVNMPSAVPAEIQQLLHSRQPAPAGLSTDEQRAYGQLEFFYGKDLGYAIEMACKPQTLCGLADSPAGFAAWMIDHDTRSYELIARVFDGQSEGLTRDDIIDNITLFWLTNTAISSARLYWENKLPFFSALNVKIPVAITTFPNELYTCPKTWAEKAYPNLIHYNKVDVGGHFAAWEQPKHLVDGIRESFKSLRA